MQRRREKWVTDSMRESAPNDPNSVAFVESPYHCSIGVSMQSPSALVIRTIHRKRTPENGRSISPSFGNGLLAKAANRPSSATTPGKMRAGGGDMSYHVSSTLYLTG